MILRQNEAEATSFPAVSGLSSAAAALDQDSIWQRLEQWMAFRWGLREVGWTVQGPGYFQPPLVPATLTTMEKWDGEQFQTVTLRDTPFGYELEPGVYNIVADVGSEDAPPAAVEEAFRRLAEYLADDAHMARSLSSQSVEFGNGLKYDAKRSPSWVAKALHTSGAADMLRGYREP